MKKTQSANTVIVKCNGKIVGLAQNVSLDDDYQLDVASGIGDIKAQEHMPTMARYSVSVGYQVLRNTSLEREGLAPVNAEAMLKGMTVDFEAYDKETGKLLRIFRQCTYSGGTIEIRKHQIITRNARYMAIDVDGDMAV